MARACKAAGTEKPDGRQGRRDAPASSRHHGRLHAAAQETETLLALRRVIATGSGRDSVVLPLPSTFTLQTNKPSARRSSFNPSANGERAFGSAEPERPFWSVRRRGAPSPRFPHPRPGCGATDSLQTRSRRRSRRQTRFLGRDERTHPQIDRDFFIGPRIQRHLQHGQMTVGPAALSFDNRKPAQV